MDPSNKYAFKEWGVVCEALRSGRQSIILRKGGIHEGRAGFRVQHKEFWILPTGFHQDKNAVKEDAADLLEQARNRSTSAGAFSIDLYAEVQRVFQVQDSEALLRIRGMHVLAEEAAMQRFNYREPGLFVLAVRVYRTTNAKFVDDSPYIAGCRSWVELPEAIATHELTSVLTDEELQQRLQSLEILLRSS